MKMGAGVFWGVLLILFGVSVLLKVLFNVHFPLFKLFIGAVFILIGLKIIFGNFHLGRINVKQNDVIFGEKHFTPPNESHKEYNVVFSKGYFDFTNIKFNNEQDIFVKINTIFAGAEIYINNNTPFEIRADAVFAGVSMPGGNNTVLGSSTYQSDSVADGKPKLILKVDAVFSGVDIHLKKGF